MNVGAIRAALATAVRDPVIPGLNAKGYMPDSIVPPEFAVGPVEGEFDRAYGGGLRDLMFTCWVLTGMGDDEAGQAELDKFLTGTGTHSIKEKLEDARGAPGQPALGGLADDLHVVRVQAYRIYKFSSGDYYGAEFAVRVIGSGA